MLVPDIEGFFSFAKKTKENGRKIISREKGLLAHEWENSKFRESQKIDWSDSIHPIFLP
jgi:hypothetical protein